MSVPIEPKHLSFAELRAAMDGNAMVKALVDHRVAVVVEDCERMTGVVNRKIASLGGPVPGYRIERRDEGGDT